MVNMGDIVLLSLNCIENMFFCSLSVTACSVQPHGICHVVIPSQWKHNVPNWVLLLPGALLFDQCRGVHLSNEIILGFCQQKKRWMLTLIDCQSSTCSQYNYTQGSLSNWCWRLQRPAVWCQCCCIQGLAMCSETDWFRNFREYLYMWVCISVCYCMLMCVRVWCSKADDISEDKHL